MKKLLNEKEYVARILKPIWYSQGKISADAFALRARLQEDYISVLREGHVDFMADLCLVCKSSIDCSYASLNVEDVQQLKVPDLRPNEVKFNVVITDNKKLKSHAGIFIKVNGEFVIGGKPLVGLSETGKAQSTVLLILQLKLAKLAEQNVKRMILNPSNGAMFASEPLKAL